MRILVCSWGNICEADLSLSLIEMGHEVVVLKEKIENKDYDLDYLKLLSEELLKLEYDCVFSINFVPIISRVCNVHHIKYVSWTVDSPWFQMNSDTVQNPCNYIFIFDRTMYNRFCNKTQQMYYMPLGTNVKFWDSVSLTKQDTKRFVTDVSFVGSLYDDKHKYDSVVMPDYLKGYLNGIIEAQTHIYGYNLLNDAITDDIVEEFSNCVNMSGFGHDYSVSKREVMSTELIGRKCAEVERTRFVKELAKNFDFDLYTLSNTESMPYVKNKGPADSRIDMPKIFKCSKINLNMTIKSIESGIPLRVYDVIGNGGFLMTNYQSELLEYFVPNEDLVIYESLEDLLFKISYYLQHDEEREQIAANGYKKVKRFYTVEQRLKDIIEVVWKDKTKYYGLNSKSSKEKYFGLLNVLSKIEINKVLDVGLFLYQYNYLHSASEDFIKDKYFVDGVQMIHQLRGDEGNTIYQEVYQSDQLKGYYDIIIMIDVLKYFEKTDIINTLEHLSRFSQIILTDYDELYVEIFQEFKNWKTQKIQVGQCELLLTTIN
ncbi:MAG: DUF3880 domain-containing protein [Lachnotalea sp.]